MNYYSVLGLNPNASDADVKKAYRKLASKHHPDKGGDIEQFKKVQEAYEKITSGVGNQPEWSKHVWEDFSRAQARPQHRNPDAQIHTEISLSQAYNGTDVIIDVGYAREIITLQPGTMHGSRVRVRGKGPNRFKDTRPGDLVVIVSVITGENIGLDNNNIVMKVPIDSISAIVGTDYYLDHVSGKKVKIKIQPNTQAGTKLRLSGWGMPDNTSNNYGDLYVLLDVYTPNITNPQHIEWLNKIKQEENDE